MTFATESSAGEAISTEKSHTSPDSSDSVNVATKNDETSVRIQGSEMLKDGALAETVQAGVKKMEATATAWSKWHLVAAYMLIWLIYFVASIEELVFRSLTPYVTSSFSLHSLTAATTIMANIIGGLSKLPLAKILDTWGRPQGMALMLFIWVLGYIMICLCKNVQTYAAAMVFATTGSQGISYCLTVFISDTSALKNRPLMLAFATSPYIVTTWIGGPVAQSIVGGVGWRWGFGIFAITIPFTVSPLILLFLWNQRRAKKMGLITSSHGKLTLKAVKKYIIEVDLLGILILAAGMALFLLPFSLYSYQAEKFRSPLIIAMLTAGGVLIIAFALYEKYLAPVTFIPFSLLTDRTVFFAGLMFFFVFFNAIVWGSYFFSMLQVVWGQSIVNASYISNIYRVGSCGFAIFVGLLIRWTGRFKWLALYFAIPLMMLAVGLMIQFRQPESDIGLVIMCQIFVAFAGGTIVLCGELAMMAPSDHQHIAVILAILNLFSNAGSAAGGTVATAIWTGVFPDALRRNLPAEVDFNRVYGSIIWQLFYKMGTPARDAINRSYGEAQRLMLITSLSLLGGALVCVALWRNINVKNMKQVGGVVV